MTTPTQQILLRGRNFTVVPTRHWGRWIAAALILAAFVVGVAVFLQADIDFGLVLSSLTLPLVLKGLGGTILLTFASMAVGIVLGTVVAVANQSRNPVVRGAAVLWIFFFRGVPALVQMLLWFNLALVLPVIQLPFIEPIQTNQLITPLLAALLGLGLSESAVMAEIVRGGILSVDKGQTLAAQSIGMSPMKTMRRIVLPQAIKVIIPPTGNETINMLKFSSLAFVVAYLELLSAAARIYTNNLKVIELLLTATIWYLVLTVIFSTVQYFIERRLAQRNSGRRKLKTAESDD